MSGENGDGLILTGKETILVPTEQLKEKADNAIKSISLMKHEMQELGDVVSGTSNYWIGEAGDQHRQMYLKYKKTQDEFMQRLEKCPPKLKEIAGIMIETDREMAILAEDLKSDVFGN